MSPVGLAAALALVFSAPLGAPPAKEQRETLAPQLVSPFVAPTPAHVKVGAAGATVVLWFDLDAQGEVQRIQVKSGSHPSLCTAALHAATQALFSPAIIAGKATASRIEYTARFAPAAPRPVTAAAALPKNLTLSLREAGVRTPVADARVALNDISVGGTDVAGRFATALAPSGTLTVSVTHPDFETRTEVHTRAPDEQIALVIYLVRTAHGAFETVVRVDKERTTVSQITLSRDEVAKVPGTLGDPVRVLENLPGMGRAKALGGQLLVRGATPQDTQVLVDGMGVPLLYHFFGLTSVINAQFVERVDFLPGGFGARYGRATAGVVDIVTREVLCDLWHGAAKVDVVDAAAYSCVPLGKWRVAVAARRSYIDAYLPSILKRISDSNPSQGILSAAPAYYDYQVRAAATMGKQAWRITAMGSLDATHVTRLGALSAVDVALGLTQQFHRLGVQHRWAPSERLLVVSNVSPVWQSQSIAAQTKPGDPQSKVVAAAWSIDWREDLSWHVGQALSLRAGLDHVLGRAQVALDFPSRTALHAFASPVFDYTATQHYESRPKQILQGYWVEAAYNPRPNLRLVPGLRLDVQLFGQSRQVSVLPRLAARYSPVAASTLKVAYGMYARLPNVQFLLPGVGNPTLTTEKAQQYTIGLEQSLGINVRAELQGYYNVRQDLTASSLQQTVDAGTTSGQLYGNTGDAHSYGGELLLRRVPSGNATFFGWLAYSLSRAQQRDHAPGSSYRRGAQILSYPRSLTDLYPSPFDQTHILTLVGQWELPHHFSAGLRGRYVTGNPQSTPRLQDIYLDVDADKYTQYLDAAPRNSDRLPAFMQLDVRIDYTWGSGLAKLTFYLEVLNATYARNVESYTYDYRFAQRAALTLLPIIPNFGVRGEF